MFGIMPPECPTCGALIGDSDKHKLFHDALMSIWQKTFGFGDEDAERITGVAPAERNARLRAVAEAHGITF